MDTFTITPKKFYWINEEADHPEDLCLHGDVLVQIGDEVIDSSGTVSSTALFLLRTLTQDHIALWEKSTEGQMLPCCGHAMFGGEDSDTVTILCCPNGDDWHVRHADGGVVLETRAGTVAYVSLDEYRRTVFAFADAVKSYYDRCQPKKLPQEDWERDGYLTFWREWIRRRG